MPAIELKTENETDRIALRGVRVRAKIAALSVKATLEQTFVNLEDRAIEAVYTFPLPEGAAVCGFEVITSDRVLTGKVDETDVAMKQYDEAIQEGHGAFALESDRPDVFTVRVGNLKPKQAVTIRISYVASLDRVDRSIRVTFPTTIAPRYATASGMNPIDAAIEGDALNPPHVWGVPYGLSMEVDVDLRQKIKSITSPTHSISASSLAGEGRGEGYDLSQQLAANTAISNSFTPRPNTLPQGEREPTRIALAQSPAPMDRDIVLSIELEKEHEPSVELVRDSTGKQFVAVSFMPEFDVDELVESPPGETVFVLDCSGSMQGESIAQATLALELCLRALSPNEYFNICRFGSTFEMMSSEPLKYSSATLNRAITYIRRDADLGGTELLAPLHAIFSAKPQAAVRNIVLMTDGQVSNEPAIIELARKHRSNHRIFSFGIGSACSAYLVKGLARGTNGASEFISGKERIEEKVLRTFSRIASPMLTDVHIDWCGADVQTLAELPPVFDGELMTIFGKLAGTKTPKQIVLRGELRSQAKSWTVDVPLVREDAERLIPTLWARRTIQSIEEVHNISRRAIKSNDTRERELVIDLSKQYGLLCSLTTFVAVEHRSVEERNEGKPELRRVPVQLAHGWGGSDLDATAPSGAVMCCMPSPPSAAMAQMRSRVAKGSGGIVTRAKRMLVDIARVQKTASTADVFTPPPPLQGGTGSELSQLLLLQQAEGFFKADALIDELFAALNLPLSGDWVSQPTLVNPHIQRTVKALQILRIKFAGEESLWKRAAIKAEKWLTSELNIKLAEVKRMLAQPIKQPGQL